MRYHYQRRSQILDKLLRWRFLLNIANYFRKKNVLDIWLGFGYHSDCYDFVLQYVQLLESDFNGLLVVQ